MRRPPFSRYLPLSIPWGQAVTERPLRVLVAISNPHDLTRYNLASLDVEKEKADARNCFGGTGRWAGRANLS